MALGLATIDNRTSILRDDLISHLRSGDKVAVAAAYFSIFGYRELRMQLQSVDEFRFLFTEPTFLSSEQDKSAREFYIPRRSRERGVYGTDLEIKLRNEMTQRAIARECANWIRKKAQFRSMTGNGAIQSFLAVEPKDDDPFVYNPVDGITAPALGSAPGSSPFTMIVRNDAPVSLEYLKLFDQVWDDSGIVEDVTERVISSVENLYAENAPELVYYSALNGIFQEFLDNVDEDHLPKEVVGFKDSKIWNMLYDFQRDAALAIINKLEKYNGCILADSVGLGKTFTALSVIKYYECRHQRVLVLCPKKLRDNWTTYNHNVRNNPVADDFFQYDVLFHTDLSREKGITETGINLGIQNLENYDLIVIDESHNFRNGGDNASKNDDRENRYQKLMNKIIGAGPQTRVLMLSATPVNNRFRDLQNQMQLAYRRSDVNWKDALNLKNDIRTTFRNAQSTYKAWSKLEPEDRTTDALMAMLDPDFFKLLDQVTVARSRKQIQRYYDASAIGPFPERMPSEARRPDLSTPPDVASFHEIADTLNQLKLASYVPSAYIQPSRQAKYEEVGLTSAGREWGIRRLMATNLLKRLESSVNSFRMTLSKVEQAIAEKVELVDEHERTPSNSSTAAVADLVPDLDLDDENGSSFTVGGDATIALEDMDWVRWRNDMRRDLESIEQIRRMVAGADAEHDSKLLELKDIIREKAESPINEGNRKVLIFTAFADTAEYLYEHISDFAKRELGLESAIITGSTAGRTTAAGVPGDTQSILSCFSPVSKERDTVTPDLAGKNIDILIATDCISEGQNLQDCDYLVNYDIHWNPVRIVQRFGRVDRIGSKNERIRMVNFWPDVELDEYINLKARVETRMRITVMTSTGDDDYLNPEEQGDLEYRRSQLEQMVNHPVDLEDVSGGVSITDLGLDEFRTDLLSWTKEHPGTKEPPHGIHGVVTGDKPGIIFVLRNVNPGVNISKGNRLHPFYLVYVGADGTVIQDQMQARDTLSRMRALCKGKSTPDEALCREFNAKTKDGRDMGTPSHLLASAVSSIVETDRESLVDSFFGQGVTSMGENEVKGLDDFELLCFLVVR